jgi:site-specific DNA-methyltransferase (adenine-specific)
MGTVFETKTTTDSEITGAKIVPINRKLPEQHAEEVVLFSPYHLKAHPKNQEIYADEPDEDMLEDIRENGIREPIVCDSVTKQVISGRRRHQAALKLHLQEIPVIWRKYGSEEDVLEAIVSHNAYRRKSERQIMMEVEALWEQEAAKGHQRQVDSGKEHGAKAHKSKDSTDDSDHPGDGEHQGLVAKKPAKLTRTEIGKAVGQPATKVARAASIIKQAKEKMGENWKEHPAVQAVFSGQASINSASLKLNKTEREEHFQQVAKSIVEIDADVRLQDHIDNIESESVDHIITQPDFDVATGYGDRLEDLEAVDVFEGWETDLKLGEISAWCHEWSRVIKTGGNIAVFCPDRYLSFVTEALLANGFSMPQLVVWHLTNPNSNSKRTMFIDSCRFVVTACMSEEKRSAFRFIGVDQMHNFVEGADVAGKNTLKHLGEQPDYVAKWLIERLTNPGDVVLDNFAGTGTTGLACKDLKRNFILVEKDPKTFEIMKARLSGLK